MSEIQEKKPARPRRAIDPRMEPPDPRPNKNPVHQPATDNKNHFHPAIYYIDPLTGSPDEWPGWFSSAAAMGFDTVLLGNLFQSNGRVNASYDLVHDRLGGGDALEFLAAVCGDARQAGVRLMLDLDIGQIAADSLLLLEYPDWFTHSPDGAAFRFLAENDSTVDWWDRNVTGFQEAGIAGFRCLGCCGISAGVWRRLITAAHTRDNTVIHGLDARGGARGGGRGGRGGF
jgi:starch synthase (maltosyl-transferring)